MSFQQVQTQDRNTNQLQKNIAAALQPLFINQLIGNGANIITQTLTAGANTINHGLGRLQIGWIPVDQDAAANFFRAAEFNTTSMILISSAPVTVSFYCF